MNIDHLITKCLTDEAESLTHLANQSPSEISAVVRKLYNTKGKLIVTGVGKSAIVAQKITATLTSTGSPACYLHATDALHGDLGIITSEDAVLILSKSGETQEIKNILPAIKSLSACVIAISNNSGSTLARSADLSISLHNTKEADPNGLAPSTSSILQMAVGDAIAFGLQSLKGFDANQFASLHPAGALGKALHMKVEDLDVQNKAPHSKPKDSLHQVIVTMTSGMVGATVICDELDKPIGIITDGDLRRLLARYDSEMSYIAEDLMTSAPKSISKEQLLSEALQVMEEHSVTQLIVTDQDGKYIGIIHMHDIIKEGIGTVK